ncbi:hypothetical protein M6B38_347745 [Iris pallida]|uniref:Uncharacterized protein n=1 Tax=Iris pallida TaxID=29817 RepID=A0AAX6GSD7_IRIPA|nr:hypothetical protein M6B38_347745 [Iris pallida]
MWIDLDWFVMRKFEDLFVNKKFLLLLLLENQDGCIINCLGESR